MAEQGRHGFCDGCEGAGEAEEDGHGEGAARPDLQRRGGVEPAISTDRFLSVVVLHPQSRLLIFGLAIFFLQFVPFDFVGSLII